MVSDSGDGIGTGVYPGKKYTNTNTLSPWQIPGAGRHSAISTSIELTEGAGHKTSATSAVHEGNNIYVCDDDVNYILYPMTPIHV